jgi:hypothetical protein
VARFDNLVSKAARHSTQIKADAAQNNRSILLLPESFGHYTAFAVRENIMVLGDRDGRLIFLEFNQNTSVS